MALRRGDQLVSSSFEDVVAKLVAAHQRESKPPWSPRNDDAIEHELRRVVQAVAAELQVEFRAEFGHYGSGYASFVDAWFFRRERSFRRSVSADHFTGLVVLLSRLAPVCCFLEGEKSWAPNGSSSSYLPSFEGVDTLTTDAVATLSHRVEEWLGRQGYVRLRKAELDKLLPQGVAVPTILTDGPYREFDALFHWED